MQSSHNLNKIHSLPPLPTLFTNMNPTEWVVEETRNPHTTLINHQITIALKPRKQTNDQSCPRLLGSFHIIKESGWEGTALHATMDEQTIGVFIHSGYHKKPNSIEHAKNLFLHALDNAIGPTSQDRLRLIRAWHSLRWMEPIALNAVTREITNASGNVLGHMNITVYSWMKMIRFLENKHLKKLITLNIDPATSAHDILIQQQNIFEISQRLNMDPECWSKKTIDTNEEICMAISSLLENSNPVEQSLLMPLIIEAGKIHNTISGHSKSYEALFYTE